MGKRQRLPRGPGKVPTLRERLYETPGRIKSLLLSILPREILSGSQKERYIEMIEVRNIGGEFPWGIFENGVLVGRFIDRNMALNVARG